MSSLHPPLRLFAQLRMVDHITADGTSDGSSSASGYRRGMVSAGDIDHGAGDGTRDCGCGRNAERMTRRNDVNAGSRRDAALAFMSEGR
jgi:hypothetical protein